MRRNPPECTRKMERHLLELQRRENLEMLRLPLKEIGLFPPHKDRETTPITEDELKALVRHWKLHEQRGFWKNHSKKEELVLALLEYKNHSYKSYSKDGNKNNNNNDNNNNNKDGSSRKFKIKPTPPKVGAGNQSSLNFTRVLRPYLGDVFSHREYPDAVVYLSRFDNGSVQRAFPDGVGTNRKVMNMLLPNIKLDTDSNYDSDLDDEEAREHAVKKKSNIAQQMYNYSLNEGSEAKIIEEGGVKIIYEIIAADDPLISIRSAATLCNLACTKESRSNMMESCAVTFSTILALLRIGHNVEEVMLCCAKCLAFLSLDRGNEERMFRDFYSALHMFENSNLEIRKNLLHFLVNLLICENRGFLPETMLSISDNLSRTDEIADKVFLSHVIRNMSVFEDLRPVIVNDEGVTALIARLVQEYHDSKEKEKYGREFIFSLSAALCNLAGNPDIRENMVDDNAVLSIVQLLEACDLDKDILRLLSQALSNLCEEQNHIYAFISSKAVPLIVSTIKVITDKVAILWFYSILSQLTLSDTYIMNLVEENCIDSFTAVFADKNASKDLKILALSGICNILSDTRSHAVMKEIGVLEMLRKLNETKNERLKELISNSLLNVACGDLFVKDPDESAIECLESLSDHDNYQVRNKCAQIFATFSSHENTCALLVKYKVISRIDKQISDPVDYIYHFAITLRNISALPSLSDDCVAELIPICTKCILNPSVTNETLLRIGETLRNLCQKSKDSDSLIENLILLEKHSNNDTDIIQLISFSLLLLSRRTECRDTVASHAPTISMMIDIMRGGVLTTQLCAAKAICNLTCSPKCGKMLLAEKSLADFIVIAILRTNDSVIKEICAASLFNLLAHKEDRQPLLDNGVLWALMKISSDCEQAQSVCAHVIFNLSFEAQAQLNMLELGVSRGLSIIASGQSQDTDPTKPTNTSSFILGVLYNVSFSHSNAILQRESGLPATHGIVQTLQDIFTSVSSGNDVHFLASILKNLSCCEEQFKPTLVKNGGIASLIFNLGKHPERKVWTDANECLYNLSLNAICRITIIEEGFLSFIRGFLDRAVKENDDEAACIACSTILHFTFRAAEVKELAKNDTLNGLVQLCTQYSKNGDDDDDDEDDEDDDYENDFENEDSKKEEKTDETVPQLAEQPTALNASKNSESSSPKKLKLKVHEICIKIMKNLSNNDDQHTVLFDAGVIQAIIQLMKSSKDVKFVKNTIKDIALILLNFSFNTKCSDSLISCGVIELLYNYMVVFQSIPDTSIEDKECILRMIATTLRNMSCNRKLATLIAGANKLFSLYELLIQHARSIESFKSLAVSLYNLFKNPNSEASISKAAGGSLVIKLLKKVEFFEDIQEICIFALYYEKSVVPTLFEEGSVTATMSLIQTCAKKQAPEFAIEPIWKEIKASQSEDLITEYIYDFMSNPMDDFKEYHITPYWDKLEHIIDDKMNHTEVQDAEVVGALKAKNPAMASTVHSDFDKVDYNPGKHIINL